MKKLILGMYISVIALNFVNYAGATTIRNAGNDMMLGGSIEYIVQGVRFTCKTEVVYSVPEANDGHVFEHALGSDPSHGHSVVMKSFTSSGCFVLVNASNATMSISANTVVISGVQALWGGGSCSGSLTGTYIHKLAPERSMISFAPQNLGGCSAAGALFVKNAGEFDMDATP